MYSIVCDVFRADTIIYGVNTAFFSHLRAMKIHMLTPMPEIRMQSLVMLLGKCHVLIKRYKKGTSKFPFKQFKTFKKYISVDKGNQALFVFALVEIHSILTMVMVQVHKVMMTITAKVSIFYEQKSENLQIDMIFKETKTESIEK